MVPRRTRIDSTGFHLGTIAVILLVVLLIWIQNPGVPHDSSISNNDKQAAKRYVHSSNDKPKVSSNLKEGVVGGVAYYHCSRMTAESIHQRHDNNRNPWFCYTEQNLPRKIGNQVIYWPCFAKIRKLRLNCRLSH